MAIWRRGKPDALLHHSDRGSQGGFQRSSQHQLFSFMEQVVKRLRGRFPTQCLSRSGIEGRRHSGYLVGAVDAQVRAFREVLPRQTVGVLASATLPRALRVAEVDLDTRVNLETIVLSHFGSLIPG